MKVIVKLLPPFKFPSGIEVSEFDVPQDFRVDNLLEVLENKGVLGDYDKDSLIILVNNQIVKNSYILKNEDTIEVILSVAGG